MRLRWSEVSELGLAGVVDDGLPARFAQIDRAAVASSLDVAMQPGALKLVGEVDVSSLRLLESALTAARPDGNGLVIDLSGLTFIDVAGTRLLVHCARRLRPAVRVTVTRPPPHVELILRAVGWEEDLEITADAVTR